MHCRTSGMLSLSYSTYLTWRYGWLNSTDSCPVVCNSVGGVCDRINSKCSCRPGYTGSGCFQGKSRGRTGHLKAELILTTFIQMCLYLTLRKIAIWLSKNCQKLDIQKKKLPKIFIFFLFGNFFYIWIYSYSN